MLTTIWKTQAISTRLRALISSFLANARGNVAVITALSALPIISAIGCVVDYSMATTIKTKLQAAADAATLAAVSANSPLVATAKAMTGNGAVSNGATYTQNFFDSNLSSSPANTGYSSPTRTGSVTKSGATSPRHCLSRLKFPRSFWGLSAIRQLRSPDSRHRATHCRPTLTFI